MGRADGRYVDNAQKLERMRHYPESFDGYGGLPFSSSLIDTALALLEKLPVQPLLSPTGRASIDMLYRRDEDKSLLSFELHVDKLSRVLVIEDDYAGAEVVEFATDFAQVMANEVEAFYASMEHVQ